jgi:hypothetical protein
MLYDVGGGVKEKFGPKATKTYTKAECFIYIYASQYLGGPRPSFQDGWDGGLSRLVAVAVKPFTIARVKYDSQGIEITLHDVPFGFQPHASRSLAIIRLL